MTKSDGIPGRHECQQDRKDRDPRSPDAASGRQGVYNLTMKGKITDVLSQVEIEQGLACPQSGHLVTWNQEIKDTNGNVIETHTWSGIPLWFLAGWVDDRQAA